jgi:hypothetical protein
VEGDRDPHGQVAAAAPPQPGREEELGEDDHRGYRGVEASVGEDRDRPVGQLRSLEVVPGPDDALPGDGAAEPVRIEELAEAGSTVDG